MSGLRWPRRPKLLERLAAAQPIRNQAASRSRIVRGPRSAHAPGSALRRRDLDVPTEGQTIDLPRLRHQRHPGRRAAHGSGHLLVLRLPPPARDRGHVPPLRADGRPRRPRLQGRLRRRGPRPQGAGARRRLTVPRRRPRGAAATTPSRPRVTPPGPLRFPGPAPVGARRGSRRGARARERLVPVAIPLP